MGLRVFLDLLSVFDLFLALLTFITNSPCVGMTSIFARGYTTCAYKEGRVCFSIHALFISHRQRSLIP